MRRAPIVIAATVVGTAGVLLFKPLPISSLESGSTDTSTGDTTSSSDTAAAPSTTPSSGTSSSSSASTSSSPTTKAVTKTVTGDVETDRYGNTQVKVTIKNGKITEVAVLAYNDGDPRSAQISESAIPTLRTEVLTKQTAAVDTVSGATYTSNAYEASLQSALDKAGFTSADGTKASTDLSTADANIFGH
jgi:uncharacterized protein with FMN-binding domain